MIQRTPAAALLVSGALLVSIATHEGYVEVATPPVPGDVATNGFGSTGADIKLGDKTTPVRALIRLAGDTDKKAQAVKRCAPVPMYQYEFDAFVSLTYNIGEGAFCGSTLVKKLNAGDYPGACSEILRWDFFQGKKLPGLSVRRQAEYRKCMGDNHDA